MKVKWQRPEVLSIREVGQIFGDCSLGSTAASTNCADGQVTGVVGTTPHACSSGGTASAVFGGCSLGSQIFSSIKSCYDGGFVD